MAAFKAVRCFRAERSAASPIKDGDILYRLYCNSSLPPVFSVKPYLLAFLQLYMRVDSKIASLLLSLTMFAGGVFFCQESFVLQHASAIFEWVFCVIIMLFYGTFAFEFASMSGDTMVVLARGGALGPAGREHKVDALGAHSQPHPHQPENMSIL